MNKSEEKPIEERAKWMAIQLEADGILPDGTSLEELLRELLSLRLITQRLRQEVEKECEWRFTGDTEWGREFTSSCGESVIETEDQQIGPEIVYCYKCGHKIRLQKAKRGKPNL